MVKLTKPQRELLSEIGQRAQSGTRTYKPLVKLLDAGLVVEKQGRFSDTYHITDLGRQALAAQEGSGRGEDSHGA